MSNSAHDDIDILDEVTIEGMPESLVDIFQLIIDMKEAEAMGEAETFLQSITMDFGNDGAKTSFTVETLIHSGWFDSELTHYDASKVKLKSQSPLTLADLNAIKEGEYTIKVAPVEGHDDDLSFEDLIVLMELYGISRPSTMSSVLEGLIQKNGLLNVDFHSGQVSVTEQGKKVHKALNKHLGDVGTKQWNSKVFNLLSDIENGRLSPEVGLLMVYEDLYGKEEREKVQHIAWTDPSILYSPSKITDKDGASLSRRYKKMDF
jgi:DNA topoisomerase IA